MTSGSLVYSIIKAFQIARLHGGNRKECNCAYLKLMPDEKKLPRQHLHLGHMQAVEINDNVSSIPNRVVRQKNQIYCLVMKDGNPS